MKIPGDRGVHSHRFTERGDAPGMIRGQDVNQFLQEAKRNENIAGGEDLRHGRMMFGRNYSQRKVNP